MKYQNLKPNRVASSKKTALPDKHQSSKVGFTLVFSTSKMKTMVCNCWTINGVESKGLSTIPNAITHYFAFSFTHECTHTHGWDRSVENYTSLISTFWINIYNFIQLTTFLLHLTYIASNLCVLVDTFSNAKKAYHFNIKILLKGYY